MKQLTEWLKNPARKYTDGLEIYHQVKKTTKHDKFLNTANPTPLHRNMLLNFMLKIYRGLSVQPIVIEKAKTEEITVKKITPKAVKKITEDAPVSHPGAPSKAYINKLLSMNWSDLSFMDRSIFFQSETYYLEKKKLFISNADISKKMTSMHAKMRALADDKEKAAERAALLEKLSMFEIQRAEQWKQIDDFKEPEIKSDTISDTEKELTRLKNEKIIKQHKTYIYRAEVALAGMKGETKEEKKRIAQRKKEVAKRKKILKELGDPYVPTEKAKKKIK